MSALRFLQTVLLATVLVSSASANLVAQEPVCRTNPKLVGQCFVVHGRLTLANGNPSVRIWQVGTKHMLGVFDGDGNGIDDIDKLPREIRPLIPKDPWQMEIFGDYTVCPFTRERAGWMRFVCIAGATHLVARNGMEPDAKP